MVKEEEISLNIIEDLLCRFIINLPKEEQTTDRLFFHIQAAHWFYSDFYVKSQEIIEAGLKAPELKLKPFARIIFKHCPFLTPYYELFDVFFQRFNKYISQVPVYGAILLNITLDKILLVTNFRNTFYSFPKGKINQNETGIECAIREVWEETGVNISKLISEKDFIEFKLGGSKAQKLYVVCGVDENTPTSTITRGEIGRIDWVPFNEIEESKNSNIFQNITPYIRPLKLWIRDYVSVRAKEKESGAPAAQAAIIENPTDNMNKNVFGFAGRLESLGREFERRLKKADEKEDNTKEKEQNPFLTFKLDHNSLREAFTL